MNAVKPCPRCHSVLPLSKFYKDKSRPDGHASCCTQCRKRYLLDRASIRPVTSTKLCTGCDTVLPADSFGKNAGLPDGLTRCCLTCTNQAATKGFRRRSGVRLCRRCDEAALPARKQYCSDCRRQNARDATKLNYQMNREARLAYGKEYTRQLRSTPEGRERLSNHDRRKRFKRRQAPHVPYSNSELAMRLSMFCGCWMCGEPATTVDHVKPLARGGWDCLSNLRPACVSCNSSKKAQWPLESRMVA